MKSIAANLISIASAKNCEVTLAAKQICSPFLNKRKSSLILHTILTTFYAILKEDKETGDAELRHLKLV